MFTKLTLLFRQIRSFGFFIPVSNLVILYGEKILPKFLLLRLASIKHQKIEKHLQKRLIRTFCSWDVADVSVKRLEPAPIWYCWLQGDEGLPAIPELCYRSLKKHSGGHPIRLVTINNYKEYVEIPDFIERMYFEGKMKPAHFTDVLRVALLYHHGGLWMDATLFWVRDIPEEVFDRPFYSIKIPEYGYYVSRCRWTVGFLAGWKGNPLFGAIFSLFCDYLRQNRVQIDYLMMDYFIDILYQRNEIIRSQIDNVPYNNSELYSLKTAIAETFDPIRFNGIIEKTDILKLDWRDYRESDFIGSNTNLYYYLLQSVNNNE